jgi:HK97 family phage prohead protease
MPFKFLAAKPATAFKFNLVKQREAPRQKDLLIEPPPAEPLKEGDFVSWGDELIGRVDHIMPEGTLNFGDTKLDAAPDNPVALVSVWKDGGFTGEARGFYLSGLTKVDSPAIAQTNQAALTPALAEGKAVMFEHDGVKVAGVIAKLANDVASVRLAIPDENGLLLASDSTVELAADRLTPFDAPYVERKMAAWQTNEALLQDGTKGVAVKDQSNRVVDYSDVMIAGYGSTFANVTAKDRDGDTVMPGAFTETIREFKRNPVMLTDHKNSVANIAGSYTEVMQDDIGLRVVGKVSNAPELRAIRFLIMEGHLKTLSMGGVFLYGPDGHTIEKVYLFEISLVAIPANPDAIFQARSLDLGSASKLFKRHSAKQLTINA